MENKAISKEEVVSQCFKIAKQRVSEIETSLKLIQEAVNNDGKSTVGDKHETGRAMAHLEQEKMLQQLINAKRNLADLNTIALNPKKNKITNGSLVFTNSAYFLIASGLGKVVIQKQPIFVVSQHAPIGVALVGKKQDDNFTLNCINYTIVDFL